MKKFMFFCCLVSLSFMISGCRILQIADAFAREKDANDRANKVQQDIIEAVRQSSEAGLGPDKPFPFNPGLFKYYGKFGNESNEYYAQKMLQEYNLDSAQKEFVEDSLHKKGYRKEYLKPRAWWQQK